MKKFLASAVIVMLATIFVNAQKPPKPTLTPSEPTAAQDLLIKEGTKLHDAKKYDEAIAKYEQVLKENPTCAIAMYELTYSLVEKGDIERAVTVAFEGMKYKSDTLPLFYMAIGNYWDDNGRSNDAIKLYKEGIDILKKDKQSDASMARLYFNLGISYYRQKKNEDAREAEKNAVKTDYGYASPHYILAELFSSTRYKIPALLAAGRMISLEQNTQRADRAATIFKGLMDPAQKNKEGELMIGLDLNAPKDEGDFMMYDFVLPTLMTMQKEKHGDESYEERFIASIKTVLAMLSEDKKIKSTFVGKYYVPFYAEMLEKGFVDVFAYRVLFGSGSKAAMNWLMKNQERATAFEEWSLTYRPPTR